LAGEQFIEYHPKGPNIGSGIQAFTLARLRAEIIQGAHYQPGLGQGWAITYPGNPKIGDPGRSILGQQHIFRLQVTMNDIQTMGAGQGIGQIQGDFEDLVNG
jgi:hypothetical protein